MSNFDVLDTLFETSLDEIPGFSQLDIVNIVPLFKEEWGITTTVEEIAEYRKEKEKQVEPTLEDLLEDLKEAEYLLNLEKYSLRLEEIFDKELTL